MTMTHESWMVKDPLIDTVAGLLEWHHHQYTVHERRVEGYASIEAQNLGKESSVAGRRRRDEQRKADQHKLFYEMLLEMVRAQNYTLAQV